METDRIETKTLTISVATIISVEVVTKVVVSKTLYHSMIVLGAARLLEIILICLIVLIWGKGLSSIGLASPRLVFGLKRGLIWSACFAMAASLASVVLFIAGINPLTLIQARLPARAGEIIIFFCIGAVLGPIAEEVFFRGILYGYFRRWGVVVALVLSTLIFVLIHPISRGVPVTQVVGGVVFALAYEVEGNLMAPITIHILGNTAIFTISLIA